MSEKFSNYEQCTISKFKRRKLMDEKEEDIKYHYVWIKNLSYLVSSDLPKHHYRKEICDRCLHYFSSVEKLENHARECSLINNCRIRLPDSEKNKYIFFKNYKYQEKAAFILYADFESILRKNTDEMKPEIQQIHEAHSIGYY